MKKILRSLAVLGLASGVMVAAVQDAEAGRRHRGAGVAAGVAAGIVGLGLLGAYSSRPAYGYYDHGPRCYRGPERCGWVGRRCWENRYGESVCRGGEWRCWRKTYCD